MIRGRAAHYWSFGDSSAAYNLSYTGSIISTFPHLTLVLAFVNISKVANLHMISFAHILRSSYFPAPYFWLWLLHFQVFSLRWSSSVLHWIDKGPLNNMCPAISIINYNLGDQNLIEGFAKSKDINFRWPCGTCTLYLQRERSVICVFREKSHMLEKNNQNQSVEAAPLCGKCTWCVSCPSEINRGVYSWIEEGGGGG